MIHCVRSAYYAQHNTVWNCKQSRVYMPRWLKQNIIQKCQQKKDKSMTRTIETDADNGKQNQTKINH